MDQKTLKEIFKKHDAEICTHNLLCPVCGLESGLWKNFEEYQEARRKKLKWTKKSKLKKIKF